MKDSRVVGQHLVYLVHYLLGTLLGSSRIGRDGHEDSTGVLIWHKTSLGGIHQYGKSSNTHCHNTCCDDAVIDHVLNTSLIFIGGLLKYAVEASVEACHKILVALVLLCLVRLQEHGAKCRRQSQGVDSRDDDTYSHCHTELAVESAARTSHERYRDEHGSHDERDGDDGTGDLIHGIDSSRE